MDTLWASEPSVWAHYLALYDEAIKEKSTVNSNEKLVELDTWLWNDLPTSVASREPKHITHAEYKKLVSWKLKRGKPRPRLQTFANELKGNSVREASEAAFSEKLDPRAALKPLVALRGCGPATGSAVLAMVDHSFPFMSDELLTVAIGERAYTMPKYVKLHEAVHEKVTEMNEKDQEHEWTAWDLERAAFACFTFPHRLPTAGNSLRSRNTANKEELKDDNEDASNDAVDVGKSKEKSLPRGPMKSKRTNKAKKSGKAPTADEGGTDDNGDKNSPQLKQRKSPGKMPTSANTDKQSESKPKPSKNRTGRRQRPKKTSDSEKPDVDESGVIEGTNPSPEKRTRGTRKRKPTARYMADDDGENSETKGLKRARKPRTR